jgi:hypothetical protein
MFEWRGCVHMSSAGHALDAWQVLGMLGMRWGVGNAPGVVSIAGRVPCAHGARRAYVLDRGVSTGRVADVGHVAGVGHIERGVGVCYVAGVVGVWRMVDERRCVGGRVPCAHGTRRACVSCKRWAGAGVGR